MKRYIERKISPVVALKCTSIAKHLGQLLASNQGEPGSISGVIVPGFSHVRNRSGRAAGRRVSSGISCLCIPALLHTHFASPTSPKYLQSLTQSTNSFRYCGVRRWYAHSASTVVPARSVGLEATSQSPVLCHKILSGSSHLTHTSHGETLPLASYPYITLTLKRALRILFNNGSNALPGNKSRPSHDRNSDGEMRFICHLDVPRQTTLQLALGTHAPDLGHASRTDRKRRNEGSPHGNPTPIIPLTVKRALEMEKGFSAYWMKGELIVLQCDSSVEVRTKSKKQWRDTTNQSHLPSTYLLKRRLRQTQLPSSMAISLLHQTTSTGSCYTHVSDSSKRLEVSTGAPHNYVPTPTPLLTSTGNTPDKAAGRLVFLGISHFPTPSFRRCSMLTSINLIGSQDLAIEIRPNLFTHSKYTVFEVKPLEPHHQGLNVLQPFVPFSTSARAVLDPSKGPGDTH
ncbi:hypothetical protein PR048_009079 [Dryococelus australis]|uniref:Uncharacterized protein n=1 Tax=Dryococelus australis TaxID=614101 RepID=A0ABQ9HYX9_9NEOP|nr:hypothetical protein PR048_009079 [Dryococelus australis]